MRKARQRLRRFAQRMTRSALPLAPQSAPAFLAAPMEHGAVGIWDEVALIVLVAVVVVAYGLWLYAVRNRK